MKESAPATPVRIAHKRCTRRNRGRHDELRILGQSQTRASGGAIRTAPVSHNGQALLAALHIAIIRSNDLTRFMFRRKRIRMRGGGGAFFCDRSADEERAGAVRFDLCFRRHHLPFRLRVFPLGVRRGGKNGCKWLRGLGRKIWDFCERRFWEGWKGRFLGFCETKVGVRFAKTLGLSEGGGGFPAKTCLNSQLKAVSSDRGCGWPGMARQQLA